jgi:hypothetical protein
VALSAGVACPYIKPALGPSERFCGRVSLPSAILLPLVNPSAFSGSDTGPVGAWISPLLFFPGVSDGQEVVRGEPVV